MNDGLRQVDLERGMPRVEQAIRQLTFEIHHSRAHAGKAQKTPGRHILLERFHGKNAVYQRNQDGDNLIRLQKRRTHMCQALFLPMAVCLR